MKKRLANKVTDVHTRHSGNFHQYWSTWTTPTIDSYNIDPNTLSFAFNLFNPNLHKYDPEHSFYISSNDEEPNVHYWNNLDPNLSIPTGYSKQTSAVVHRNDSLPNAIAKISQGIAHPIHINNLLNLYEQANDPIGIAHEDILERKDPKEMREYKEQMREILNQNNVHDLTKNFLETTPIDESLLKYDRLRRQFFRYIVHHSFLKESPLIHDIASFLTGIKYEPYDVSTRV